MVPSWLAIPPPDEEESPFEVASEGQSGSKGPGGLKGATYLCTELKPNRAAEKAAETVGKTPPSPFVSRF